MILVKCIFINLQSSIYSKNIKLFIFPFTLIHIGRGLVEEQYQLEKFFLL